MNIAMLERDLGTAKDKARALIETTAAACRDHVVTPATATAPAVTGRLMTDKEKAEITAALGEAEAIQLRLTSAQGDAALISRVEQLAGGSRTQSTAPGRRDRRTLGQQFTEHAEYLAFIKAQGHRRAGAWNSPQIECYEIGGRMYATTLTEDPASGGGLVQPQLLPGFVQLNQRRPVVADLIAPGTTTTNSIHYVKEKTFTNAAAAVLEGGPKPESALIFEPASSDVRKLAHWIPVSEEMLEDVPQVRSVIDSRLTIGLELVEEDQLLNGDGIAPNLLGYMELPGMTAPYPKPGAESIADAMLKQITKIATTTFIYPDGWIMNPADWMSVQLAKTAQGNYMGSGPWAAPQTPQLWGLPGVVTPAMLLHNALVGAFRTASQLFRRDGIRIEATNSHADFFVKNLVAIRAEERLALAVYREAAFGPVTSLDSVPVIP